MVLASAVLGFCYDWFLYILASPGGGVRSCFIPMGGCAGACGHIGHFCILLKVMIMVKMVSLSNNRDD